MKKEIATLLLFACIATAVQAQVYNQIDENGQITQRDERNGNFNPNRRDSVQNKEIPRGVRAWTVDRQFGDIRPTELDTMPHLYQNTIFNTGIYGEYNSIGNNYSSRLSRIVIDRPQTSQFFFTQPYDYTTKEPDQFLFLNTLSPYTNISYDNCGNKQNGEDHIDAKFGINANKRLGLGFDLDYYYARGYYQNQSNSHFRASLYGTYVGDRYQMHALFSTYHRKATENGGIGDDRYITHPESFDDQFSEEEIPTVLSKNWNRNNSIHLFLSHRYNFGFYRKVKMTEEEIKARQFAAASAKDKEARENKNKEGDRNLGRKGGKVAGDMPTGRPENARIAGDLPKDGEKPVMEDSTRVRVESQQQLDSLMAAQAQQDSIDATMKRVYVPVTSFIHTLDINSYSRIYQAYNSPTDYYLNTFYKYNDEGKYGNDSIYDKTKYVSFKNTFAIALLEGFNKYAKAGIKGFISYDHRKFQMPDLDEGSDTYYMNKWTEGHLSVGGQISKTQGKTLHYNVALETWVAGADAGSLKVDFSTDLNFPLFGDTVQLAAKAYFHRLNPTFFQRKYHSKHLWWDDSDLSKETHTHIEGIFSYPKTNTQLRIAVDEIQNYTYFGMDYNITESYGRSGLTAGVYQESGNINLLTAQLRQNFRLGILNWENVITYQHSSNKEVLPVPALNIFTNLYLKFKIAKVLSVELGGDATFFTKYYAPDYVPQLAQFAIHMDKDNRIELGNYPFVDVYANFHLKRARFFIMMSHVNNASGNKMIFLAPHYPVNGNVLRLGVSWNFYN
ncbi:MAG: putative porin [Prevotella sp.]|nr:putative porin [Prevotella sp.]